jgi:hypothetical protein
MFWLDEIRTYSAYGRGTHPAKSRKEGQSARIDNGKMGLGDKCLRKKSKWTLASTGEEKGESYFDEDGSRW